MATIEDFKKLEFVVAQIKEVTEHPDADRLYVLKIDIGEEEPRQLVAGIRKSYTPEQLVDRQIIVIKNLEPAVIRGVESQGMLLAVGDAEGSALLQPDRKAELGKQVR